MKIQNKLVITAVATIGLTAFVISAVALNFTQRNELNRVDSELVKVTFVKDKESADLITPALRAAETSGKRILLSVLTSDGDQIQVDDRKLIDLTNIARAELKSASASPLTVFVLNTPYRISAINLGGGDFLVATFSLAYLDNLYSQNLNAFIWISLGAVFVGSSIVGFIVRRDLTAIARVIDYSETVSRGQLDAKFSIPNKSAEIVQLRDSLDRMITYLSAAIRKEQETQISIKNFLGDAAHELKTPLTVIKGYNELLSKQRKDMSSEGIDSAHKVITTQIDRMDLLVKDLLLITEIQTSNEIENELLNFSGLIQGLVEEYEDEHSNRKVEVNFEKDIWVLGSNRLLSRMVTNILRNIDVHTPSDAPVRVELKRDGQNAFLKIEDGGPGLPAEYYDSGIQGFQRFDASRSRETGGTGLGMSIIASVIHRHNGQIQLNQSSLGGLRIDVKIPLNS
jgi:two-component system, OmpR family, sensor kinase